MPVITIAMLIGLLYAGLKGAAFTGGSQVAKGALEMIAKKAKSGERLNDGEIDTVITYVPKFPNITHEDGIKCPSCNKICKNSHGLAIHYGKMHKK